MLKSWAGVLVLWWRQLVLNHFIVSLFIRLCYLLINFIEHNILAFFFLPGTPKRAVQLCIKKKKFVTMRAANQAHTDQNILRRLYGNGNNR
jgi:hypothetical protein